MYKWAEDLFPICRSITGPGVRETLKYINDLLPNLEEASKHKWITIWIHPNSHLSGNYDFVDYAFPNIITALIHFNKKAKVFT